MAAHSADEQHLQHALELARQGLGLASPNPHVGAVIADAHGKVIGTGTYTYAGVKHAEILALEAAGKQARGATLYINLEPHSHYGRTSPCTDALIAAGIRRVVACMPDPNPKVSGAGFEKLRAAAIHVEVGRLEAEARRLNEAFETIYGPEAEDMIRAWGRRATERWLAEGRHGLGGARRFVPGRQRKLAGVVKNFSEAMDNVRGEHTHAWLQVDEHQFWLVHFSNMFALGRIKTVKSCYVWTSAIETILRWAGLANDWYVEEVECGSVTGTFDCAFAIRASETS